MFARLCLQSASSSVFRGFCHNKSHVRQFHRTAGCWIHSEEFLGLAEYRRTRGKVHVQYGNLKEDYFEQLQKHMDISEKNPVFIEDLKNLLHLVETEEQLLLACKMLKRYHKQRKSVISLQSYKPGPVMMRLCYELSKPDVAFDLFMDQDLKGMFVEYSSCLNVLDMVFKSSQYEKVVEMMEQIQTDQMGRAKYGDGYTLIAVAALCKINTPEALEQALSLLKKAREHEGKVLYRTDILAAYLAIKQGQYETAIELLKNVPETEQVLAAWHLQILVLVGLGKVEGAVDLLQDKYLNNEIRVVYSDVLDAVKEEVKKTEKVELLHKFEQIRDNIAAGKIIPEFNLESYLFRLQRKSQVHNIDRNSRRAPVRRRDEDQFTNRS